ncbi:TonB-dependent receptor domain-containing protein [Acinetobacter sp. WZC-1]|uniref:TonB-dependent receptor domain-containing protein n=1 Tax=Acinetobacter sp. WZC-1 TaxID=3459034 RepID=UPI00403DE4A0
MRYTTLMLFILVAMQNAQAEDKSDIPVLKALKYQAESNTDPDVVVVSKDRIEEAKTLGDAVQHISGVQNSAFGPNAGAPVIRGLSGNRVSILENGQAVNGMNSISGDINIPFDPLFTRSITLNKSSDAVRYGGHAVGGSVDIDTGLISRTMEEKNRSLDVVFKKGFNNFDARGIKLNINNQKNLSTNIQFSTQEISSYKIPGYSKASICDTDVFPPGGGVNSSLSAVCQRDTRIQRNYNTASQPYINQFMRENPDYADDQSSYYTDQPVSNWFGGNYTNPVNPDYVPNTPQYTERKINADVTPNYHKKLGNSYAKNENIAMGTTYFLNNGYIGVSVDHKKSSYGVPGFSMENKSFQESYDDGRPVGVQIEQNRFAVEALLNNPVIFLDSLQLNVSRVNSTTGEYIGSSKSNNYKFDTSFAELLLKHKPVGNLSGELGLSFASRDVNGSGPDRYLPNVKTDTQAAFITEKLNFNKFYVDAGYRIEKVDHQIKDLTFKQSSNSSNGRLQGRDFDLGSYFAGAGLKLTDYLGFRVKYSESERAPELNELYSSGPHYSHMTQEEGNQNLNEEKVKTLEFTTTLDFRDTQLKATLYRTNYDNYLYLLNSGMETSGNRLPLKYWRQTDTDINGFEIDLSQSFDLANYGQLTVSGFADLVKNKVAGELQGTMTNTGAYMSNIPTNRYGATVEWSMESLSARLSSIYYDKAQYLTKNVNMEPALPAYNMVDLSISKKVSLKNADFDFFINGQNLLDEDARPYNSPLRYIAPLPGRSFQLGITMHI